MAQSLAGAQGTRRGTRQVKVAPEKETGENPGDLQMTSAEMRDLTQKVAELVLSRYENLPTEPAWEGEFRLELEDQLMEDPPEDGRSARSCRLRRALTTPASLVLSPRHLPGLEYLRISWWPAST